MTHPLPTTIVCAGGGGVGKTTSSAAIAVALARRGATVLVVTVDPARRLAAAMGVEIDERVQPAHVDPAVEGRLFALMPEPRRSTPAFAEILYEGRPDDLARVLANPVYATMADAAAGMHEIVSLILVAKAVEERRYDYLVIDTAPSRNALDFVSYPGRLAVLFEGRALGWFGSMAQRAQGDGTERRGGFFSGAQDRAEALFSRIMNPRVLRDLTQLFADLTLVRERFAKFARISESLLLGPGARYVLVGAPTSSAQADVEFLAKRLDRLKKSPAALLLNRADLHRPDWVGRLEAVVPGWPALGEALQQVDHEMKNRRRAGDRLAERLAKTIPRVPQVRTPTVEASDPAHIVRALATELTTSLSIVAGR